MTDLTIPPPIKFKLVDIYDTNWKSTNAIEPLEIDTGRYNETLNVPQLTVSTSTESAEGLTGFKYMSNSGPIQKKNGRVQVNLWTTAEAIHAVDTSVSPEGWLERARQELGRITRTYVVSLPGYDSVAWDSGQDRHESDREPTLYRRMCFVTYSYKVI